MEKAIQSYALHRRNSFHYFYGHDMPAALQYPGRKARKLAVRFAYECYRAFAWAFPRQQNIFAFFISPTGVQPWIQFADGEPRLSMA